MKTSRRALGQEKVKSIAYIRPKSIRSKEGQRVLRARRELDKELKEEQEEANKALTAGTCFTERMKNIFSASYKKMLTRNSSEVKTSFGRSIKIRKAIFESECLNKIAVFLCH
eukprot:TRINITY_DN9915_c0_g1_i7.p2 TRINITY_DN9915_c0_g1~~TRINITY_DN9915_c0_g1_i7.p2  ORF type:complete len:113 (-),score=15.83 TRINITY_DN9915_c0_g1_i7:292-630(-)